MGIIELITRIDATHIERTRDRGDDRVLAHRAHGA